jgi:hypothetical protein
MSINVNVGNLIPADVVEVGQEISADQLAAITSASSPSAVNPFTTASHGHAISAITGLQTALDGKASATHTHIQSDITGLQASLDAKTPYGHSHSVADITSLQTELDGKALLTHSHVVSDITGLQTALDGKASTSHLHTGVYAPATHSHAIADTTGLQTALDGKASTTHTHTGYALLTGATFSGEIETPSIGNLLNADLVIDSYNDTGAGTHYYHKFTPFDGRFVLAPNGGGLVFPDTTIQSTASYSKAQSDAHLTTVAGWVNTKADWGHTHAIADVTGLQTALDSKMAATQSWLEFDIGRTFTITNGVLSWDNGSSTLSHPMSGNNAGNFVFNKKLALLPPTATDAGINIGTINSTANLTNSVAGDVWIGTWQMAYKTANGTLVYSAATNASNVFGAPQIIDTTHNSTPALRVTQKGTANSLVIEDSTTPDTSSLVVDSAGRVSINSNPASPINTYSDFWVQGRAENQYVGYMFTGGTGHGLYIQIADSSKNALTTTGGVARFYDGIAFGTNTAKIQNISAPVVATGTYNQEIQITINGANYRIPCRQV